MKKVQLISDSVLLARTKTLVARERRITLSLIEHLAEIDARKLFAKEGYSSLWEYCTLALGLSEGAAMRRIQAMRLSREIPEAREAISDGKLSLSNASQLQSFFQLEKKIGKSHSKEYKKELIQALEGMSQKQAQRKLCEISPQSVNISETIKPISVDQNEVKLILNSELLEKLTYLKDRMAHQLRSGQISELIELLVDEKIKIIEKKMSPRVEKDFKGEIKPEGEMESKKKEPNSTAAAEVENQKKPVGRQKISIKTQRELTQRSGDQCEYVASSGKRCNSRHRIEIEHKIPVAHGGSNELSNLMHLCRGHNNYQATLQFGREFMS
jgi:hypothetical protein